MKYKEFLERARKVHGDKYEYNDFVESTVNDKIKILCPIHGEFEQTIYAHLRGQGCPKCIGERRGYTTDDFIREAKKKFGDKFDYSKTHYENKRKKVCIMYEGFKSDDNPNGEFWQLPIVHLKSITGLPFIGNRGRKYGEFTNIETIKKKTIEFIEKVKKAHGDKYDCSKAVYTGCMQKVKLICPIHGEFEIRANNVVRGHGCPKCGNIIALTKNEFIEKAKKVHGDKYDYSKVEIKKTDDKVCIICHEKDENGKEHGEFWQTVSKHLNSSGCHICAKNKKLTNESFIEKAKQVHGDKYDYSHVNYINSRTKINIICPIHGEFYQSPISHLNGATCPYCNESHLEEEISLFLTNNGIKYERQAKFPNIKFKKELPFDFFIPSKKVIIECQGEQHFEKSKIFKDEYRFTKDRIKYNGCLKNGFKLLYYTNIKNYEKYFNKLTYNEKNLFKDKNIILEKIKRD